MQFQDYYKTLGVSRTATQDEIQKAYRALARKYHPDVNKEKGSEEQFKKVSEAYEVLKSSESRKKYDALGSGYKAGDNFRPPPGWQNVQFDFSNLAGGAGFGGFSSFFDAIFGGGVPRTSRRSVWQDIEEPAYAKASAGTPPLSVDSEMTLNLSPWEAALGTTLEVATLSGKVKLKIPPGSQSGTRMRLKGKGQITRQGPSDLYLNLQIKVPSKLTPREKELLETLAKESKFNARKS
jgi:curved DNA-binding protein